MQYIFEWDKKKALNNVVKHNIPFERAISIFKDPNAISIFDDIHSMNEERWITIGIDNNGTLLVVVHTFIEHYSESNKIRIISARKATKNEINQYSKV